MRKQKRELYLLKKKIKKLPTEPPTTVASVSSSYYLQLLRPSIISIFDFAHLLQER